MDWMGPRISVHAEDAKVRSTLEIHANDSLSISKLSASG
jgi:hypothetical protein